jgi:hypothetical protein
MWDRRNICLQPGWPSWLRLTMDPHWLCGGARRDCPVRAFDNASEEEEQPYFVKVVEEPTNNMIRASSGILSTSSGSRARLACSGKSTPLMGLLAGSKTESSLPHIPAWRLSPGAYTFPPASWPARRDLDDNTRQAVKAKLHKYDEVVSALQQGAAVDDCGVHCGLCHQLQVCYARGVLQGHRQGVALSGKGSWRQEC